MTNNKLSIITPSYNQGAFIEKTIQSVLTQDIVAFEHIIIDGGSSDQTLDILKKYNHLNWVSEPDKGQSHAINKGLQLAKGEIIGWINSDDYYPDNSLKTVIDYFDENPTVKMICGDLIWVDKNGNNETYEKTPAQSYFKLKYLNPHLVRQPCTFFKKVLVDEVGFLDESLHYVMDLDYILRMLKVTDCVKIEKPLAVFRYYEESKSNNKKKQLGELAQYLKKQQVPWFAPSRLSTGFKLK